MHESPLAPWANFYVIVGSAAATLTGLMFVVITLLAGARARRSDMGIAAFNTPTIVHYCVALAVAAILNAPWHTLWHAGVLLGCAGCGGLAYSAVVVRRIPRVEYRPVLEDWAWHVIFPIAAYVAVVAAAALLPGRAAPALFLLGAATVLLLFIGIHNAWDNVTFIVTGQVQHPAEDPEEDQADGPNAGQAHVAHDGEGAPAASPSSSAAP